MRLPELKNSGDIFLFQNQTDVAYVDSAIFFIEIPFFSFTSFF
jgi:hypothetical protein